MIAQTKQSRQSRLTRLVGNNFRLAGSLVLSVLPEGQPLLLDPEPENPHDPDAIRVCVDMTGSEYSKADEGPVIHLGYIPRSRGSTDSYGFGNKEVLSIMQGGPDWNAFLTFSPSGDPLVRLEWGA